MPRKIETATTYYYERRRKITYPRYSYFMLFDSEGNYIDAFLKEKNLRKFVFVNFPGSKVLRRRHKELRGHR